MIYRFPNGADASEDIPAFSGNTDNNGGWFTEFDPLSSKLPTVVSADFLNMILKELRDLGINAGVPLDTEIGNVLTESINRILQNGTSNNAAKLNNKSPSYYLSSTNLTGIIPQARLANSYNFDQLNVDHIREKTLDVGVTVEQVLIKDNKIYMPGNGIISTDGTFYFDIDVNDNETNRGFMVRNNGVTRVFYIEDDGRANIDCAEGGAMLRLYDVGADTENAANPYIDFRYTHEQGASTKRLGRLGPLSSNNPDFMVQSENGSIRLEGLKILANGKEVAIQENLANVAQSSVGRNLLGNADFIINNRNYLTTTNIPNSTFVRDLWETATAGAAISVVDDGTVTMKGQFRQVLERNDWAGEDVIIEVENPSVDIKLWAGSLISGYVSAGSGVKTLILTGDDRDNANARSFYIRANADSNTEFSFKNLRVYTRKKTPDLALAKLKSQAHYQTYNFSGLVATKSPDGYVANITFPEMASIPSVMSIPVYGGGYNGSSAIGISTVLVDSVRKNSIRLLIETSSPQSASSIYVNGLELTLYTGL